MAETCFAKRDFTQAELMELTERVDLEDGVADGKLNPETIRPAAEEEPAPATPESYFQDLGQQASDIQAGATQATDPPTNFGEPNGED